MRALGPFKAVVVLVAAALTSAALPGGPATAAAEPAPPTLVDVRLSRGSVAVTGLGTVAVTVSVHLTDPAGVIESSNPEIPAPWPQVTLSRVAGRPTAGAPRYDVRDLDLTSGSARDGIWTATVRVPSTYEGTWQVTNVTAQNTTGGTLSADPRRQGITRSLRVAATHQPTLSLGFTPSVIVGAQKTLTVRGRALDADTGRPVRGLVLTLGDGNRENCGAFGYGGSASTVTDARGAYTFRGVRADAGYACVMSTLPAKRGAVDRFRTTTLLFRLGFPPIQPVVTAKADRTSVRVGETVPVRGVVTPVRYMSGRQVLLQRLVGRTWRTVGTSRIRDSGRYTLQATPPSAGRHSYRAVTEAVAGIRAAASPTVVIRAR